MIKNENMPIRDKNIVSRDLSQTGLELQPKTQKELNINCS